jgi:cob(I)alamin adenosyltransferase
MYTRGGDSGETSLFGAKRVAKDSRRVEAYGTVDELNCCIGLAIATSVREEISEPLREIQNRLFVVGADLAADAPQGEGLDRVPRIGKDDIKWLEERIDDLLEKLPRLTNFILPGGSLLSANLQIARAICRRAERRVVSIGREEKTNPEIVPFLNRLSTYLFDLSRYANSLEGLPDQHWKKRSS